VVFAIATAIGGINAVFVAAQSAPASNLGQTTILYAVTAAFVAGPSASILTIAAYGLLIGLIESLSGIFVTQGWQSVVVFSILLIYVIVRAGTTVNWSAVLRRRVATPQSTSSQLGVGS
jgi:branched-subunit amino acid ABC-type transport system permease component